MRILIIGGTRFTGPHIAWRLSADGHYVTVFHRGESDAPMPPTVEHILGDRRNLPHFKDEFKALNPEIVIDMISFTEQDALDTVNIFKDIARRLIVLSSSDVYRARDRLWKVSSGPLEVAPQTEESPLREALYPYRSKAESDDELAFNCEKILVEQVVMNCPELPGTILRLPAVHGPGNRSRVLEYLKRMDDGRPVILLDRCKAQWRFCRGYVENVAAAIVLACLDDKAANRIYNVADNEAFTELEWIQHIGQAADWDGQILLIDREALDIASEANASELPDYLLEDLHWQQDWVTDTSRLREELGYSEPIPQNEAMRRTISWVRSHPAETVDEKQFNYKAEDALLAQMNS